MLDTASRLSLDALEKNTRYGEAAPERTYWGGFHAICFRTIAEAVLGHMLSLPEGGFTSDPRVSADTSVLSRDAVDRQRLAHAVRLFASRPRPVADEAATVACAANLAVAVGNYVKVVS